MRFIFRRIKRGRRVSEEKQHQTTGDAFFEERNVKEEIRHAIRNFCMANSDKASAIYLGHLEIMELRQNYNPFQQKEMYFIDSKGKIVFSGGIKVYSVNEESHIFVG